MAKSKRQKSKAKGKAKSTRPVYKARAGRLSCAVFLNRSKSGSFYSINPQRVFENVDGDLENATSFNESDLPTLAALVRECWEFCRTNPIEDDAEPDEVDDDENEDEEDGE